MTSDEELPTRRPGSKGGGSWARRRAEARLTISEVAERSGVPRSVVGMIDQGRMVPTPDEAAAILAALGGRE